MGVLDNRDFTLVKYEQVCQAIANSRYVNVTFQEYFTQPNRAEHLIILRHDIDEDSKYASDIAKVEYRYNLKGTYYFRMSKKTYVPTIIDEIATYNHEIGYHYETVDRCNGDLEAAVVLFENELSAFRQRYAVTTACMHGNPLTKYDNKAIWQKRSLLDFGLLGEPYLSLDYAKFAYFSDSGRTWEQSTGKKMKDQVATHNNKLPKNTDELIEIINTGELPNICILTHPERWPKNLLDYSKRYLIDTAYVLGKAAIRWRRNL
ncbi:hypothetical protein MUP77_25210 [Candidatus Bathyarchaeota archaeon]|nr:hypothetical protein [Candidatus Bathyarchaeota archaeon]